MKAGDLVFYSNGNHFEIGVIKRETNPIGGYFVWYNIGDTASCTKECDLKPLCEPLARAMVGDKFVSNGLYLNSLLERRRRLLEGLNTEGLIDVYLDGSLLDEPHGTE